MCGLLDDLLPVFGAIAGGLIGGPWGAALGGSLGGFGGQYFQSHDFGQSLFGGAVGGIGGYFGGADLANSLFGQGASALGDLAGTAGANAAPTLGALESGAGGAALFGPAAGTGTAIGGASGALGGAGLGIAGGDALSGISAGAASSPFFGALGGGTQGTGLGVGSLPGSQADLYGGGLANAQTTGGATPGATGPTAAPLGSMSNTPTGTGSTAGLGNTLSGNAPVNAQLGTPAAQGAGSAGVPVQGMEGAQAAPVDQNAMAAGAVTNPGTEAGSNLSTMYGPTSSGATLPTQSPMGQGVAGAGGGLGQNVQAGALGEAGGSAGKAMDLSDVFNQASPWMRLANTAYGAYQNYQQQQAQRSYMNQINNEFSPNSPYAQQMQQTLARQDAAAGRNSQYGTRAVQLAAALTQARAQALGNSNYYRAASQPGGLATMFNPVFANFGSPQGMQQLGQLGTSAFNGLSSLFSGF